MDREPKSQPSKGSEPLRVPVYVQVYVWFFMVSLSLSPTLYVLLTQGHLPREDACDVALMMTAMIQAALWLARQCCSTADLSYWEGLLVAATSVTTGRDPISLFRAFWLLLATVLMSLLFVMDHDATRVERHAALRFGKLIIWLHKQRLWGHR